MNFQSPLTSHSAAFAPAARSPLPLPVLHALPARPIAPSGWVPAVGEALDAPGEDGEDRVAGLEGDDVLLRQRGQGQTLRAF
eukprot:1643718-Alexandrium_andersonii.AAC.1